MGLTRFAVIGAALCLLAAAVFAQSDTASISGFVKDATGGVVPNASVSVRNEATGLDRKTATNESGYYVASSLPPGFYTVTIEATGFKRYVKTQNKLDANIPGVVSATLEVGTVTESVEVVAAVAQLQTESATLGKLIEEKQIKNMMLNGRNPLYLAQLKPGVRGGTMNAFSFGLTTAGLNINGGRTQDLVLTFDGAIGVRTRANGTSIGVADVETVQEIQILTANYTAEYGRSSGGQVRFVTKSGSRDFHGSLYEYFRNEKLDANTWLFNRNNQQRPANKFNQYGYLASGPAFLPGKWNTDRQKLFWLWGQEWVSHRREQSTTITVPSLAMRRGDFSELLDPSNFIFRTRRLVNDPTNNQPFANNVIPQSRLSPNGVGFLRSYPEPLPGFLLGTANFFQVRPNPTDQRKDTLSIDFMPSERHTFRLRWQNYEFDVRNAFAGGTDRAVTQLIRPNDTASLNYIWTISPRTINEFLVTAAADRVQILVQREGGRFERSKYGINYPYIFPQRKEIVDKIPTIEIRNFATIDGGPYPASSAGPVYTISNNTTRIQGSHTFKWGVNVERSGQNDFDQINVSGVPGGTNNQNGRFVFTDVRAGAATTSLALSNAVLGLFDTYAEIGPRSFTPYRGMMLEFFGQDSWKATQKLKLEVGLRWSVQHPYYYSLWGNIAAFDPARYDPTKAVVQDPRTGNILSGDRYNGVLIPGSGFPDAAKGRVPIADSGEFNRLFNNGPTYWGQVQYRNFQPRLGLAYQLTQRDVLRAGFGRFMARPGVSDNIYLGGNPPFQPMISIANGQADNPGGGGAAAFPQFFMTSDPVFKIPNAYNWSVTYEREVGFDTTVSAAYVGRVGLHLERERELNQLRTGTLFQPGSAGVNVNALRPFKGFAFVPLGEMAARSEYNSFQLEVNRRFARGLSFGLAYTLAESFDNASGRRDRLYDAHDDRSFWGHSGFDNRHTAVINFIYELPFLKGDTRLLSKMLGGWMISGVTQFQTGTPITIGTGDDFPGIGSGDGKPWNRNGDPTLPNSEKKFSQGAADSNFYFRTRNADGGPIFTQPANGTFANQTRNDGVLYNVGFQNWNLGVYKDFKTFESQVLKLRLEMFNWINHPNWGGVDGGPRSGTFGKVLTKSSERNIQLSLRYDF